MRIFIVVIPPTSDKCYIVQTKKSINKNKAANASYKIRAYKHILSC